MKGYLLKLFSIFLFSFFSVCLHSHSFGAESPVPPFIVIWDESTNTSSQGHPQESNMPGYYSESERAYHQNLERQSRETQERYRQAQQNYEQLVAIKNEYESLQNRTNEQIEQLKVILNKMVDEESTKALMKLQGEILAGTLQWKQFRAMAEHEQKPYCKSRHCMAMEELLQKQLDQKDYYKSQVYYRMLTGAAGHPSGKAVYLGESSDNVENEFYDALASTSGTLTLPSLSQKSEQKNLSFNMDDGLDRKSLILYESARRKLFLNQNHSVDYTQEELLYARSSAKMIELRMQYQSTLNRGNYFAIRMAESILKNDPVTFLQSIEFFNKNKEFSLGLSQGLFNELSPTSLIAPLSLCSDSNSCKYGEAVGEILAGLAEMATGITYAISSLGGSAFSIIAAPATGGASLALTPATVASASAGIALAGYGASNVASGFSNLLNRISENPGATQVLSQQEKVQNKAKELGVTTHKGVKTYSKIHNRLESLPDGLKVQRIKEGQHVSKIAMVGRSMKGGVDDAALHLRNRGLEIDTFSFSDAAKKDFLETVRNYSELVGDQNARLPYEEVKKTLGYRENRKWIEDKVRGGYIILDIGDPLGKNVSEGASAFYDLELQIIQGLGL